MNEIFKKSLLNVFSDMVVVQVKIWVLQLIQYAHNDLI